MPLLRRIRFGQLIPREEFERLIRVLAWQTWSTRERSRRQRDWYEAKRLLGIGSHVGVEIYEKIRSEAEEVHRWYKDADALEDWLEAESVVSRNYQVAS